MRRRVADLRWKAGYLLRYQYLERFQRWLPTILPRWLVYRTVIMAYGRAWVEQGGKTPDELTFDDVVGPWERGER